MGSLVTIWQGDIVATARYFCCIKMFQLLGSCTLYPTYMSKCQCIFHILGMVIQFTHIHCTYSLSLKIIITRYVRDLRDFERLCS